MRHDNPTTPDGFTRGGRVLLETFVANNSGAVEFDLPSSYSRFIIEVDDWAGTANHQDGHLRFGIDNVIRTGGSDYAWTIRASAANDNGDVWEDTLDDEIQLTGSSNNTKFGSDDKSSYSFTLNIDPGSSENHCPRVAWSYSGRNSALTAVTGNVGGGIYNGTTSGAFGRATQVQILMQADSIKRGTFRLYGTE